MIRVERALAVPGQYVSDPCLALAKVLCNLLLGRIRYLISAFAVNSNSSPMARPSNCCLRPSENVAVSRYLDRSNRLLGASHKEDTPSVPV